MAFTTFQVPARSSHTETNNTQCITHDMRNLSTYPQSLHDEVALACILHDVQTTQGSVRIGIQTHSNYTHMKTRRLFLAPCVTTVAG